MFIGALLAVTVAATVTGDNLLFLLAASMLATLMISNLIAHLSLAGLELDLRLPEHISARRKFPARIEVRNTKRWMPSFSVRLAGIGESVFRPIYFPVLAGRASLSHGLEIEFSRRGLHREDGFEFTTCFPFGFFERSAQVSLRQEILVYPCMNPQPVVEDLLFRLSGEMEAHYRGRGHDFYRIRPYELFESVRHVDWKATAHTGELQVREFAREEEPLVEILLDLDVPASEADWFERAVELCAYLVWHLAIRESRVRFVTAELAVTAPATGDVYRILKYLGLVAAKSGAMIPPPAERGSFHIVLTPDSRRFEQTGWSEARFITPESLAAAQSS